jgi:predicted dehydrogenase
MKSVGIGMIGAGQISKSHVLGFSSISLLHGPQSLKSDLVAVAEVNERLAKEAAHNLGFRRWTADWREVTRSDDVDLVDIITPTYMHKEPAIDAADHHKNILCEKPLSTDSKQSKEMYEAAKRAGIKHMVGFNYRRLSAVSFAKKLIDEGNLGRIYHFRASFLEDWGADPNFGFTWRFQSKNAGAGALADLGSHSLDLARYLVGDVAAVCGIQDTFIPERPVQKNSSGAGKVDVDDTTMCLLKFRNGTLGRIDTSWCAMGRKVYFEFELNGSEGSVFFNLERPNELQIYSSEDSKDRRGYKTVLMGPVHPYGQGIVFPAPGAGMGFEESLVNEIHDLMDGIQNGQEVLPSFYDGWKVNQMIDAILESERKQAWVQLKEAE